MGDDSGDDPVKDHGDDPVDVVRGYLGCGDAGAFDALSTWVHDDVVVHPAGGGAPYVGVPELALTWAEAHEGLSSLRHDVRDVVAQGDLVALRVRVHGTHDGVFLGIDPTGRSIEVDQGLFARLVDGRIAELWEVTDTGQALQGLGRLEDQVLSPGPQAVPRPPAGD